MPSKVRLLLGRQPSSAPPPCGRDPKAYGPLFSFSNLRAELAKSNLNFTCSTTIRAARIAFRLALQSLRDNMRNQILFMLCTS